MASVICSNWDINPIKASDCSLSWCSSHCCCVCLTSCVSAFGWFVVTLIQLQISATRPANPEFYLVLIFLLNPNQIFWSCYGFQGIFSCLPSFLSPRRGFLTRLCTRRRRQMERQKCSRWVIIVCVCACVWVSPRTAKSNPHHQRKSGIY